MAWFLYFAYGSNLLTPRLVARCPSAEPLGRASAPGHGFAFAKRSRVDGSGKATLVPGSAGETTPGLVWRIRSGELAGLDAVEGVGLGYDRLDGFPVQMEDGGLRSTLTYIATAPEPGLRPFDWYLALVVAGLGEHALPGGHAASLHDPDPEPDRPTRIAAIEALTAAGHGDWVRLLDRSATI